MGQVVSMEELAELARDAKSKGKRVVHCHGVFDLLHIGHIRHLRAARALGDVMVVTITPDRFVNKGPGRPAFGDILRTEALAALADVDYVAVSLWPTAVEAIRLIKPDFYVKGNEYLEPDQDVTGAIVPEREAVEANGGEMRFTGEVSFSSSRLLNQYFPAYPPDALPFLKEFRSRYSAETVSGALASLRNLRALVVGETIVDEYHFCQPEGSSPKRHLVVHRYVGQEGFIGGAAMTAAHMAGFVKDVTLATACTQDQAATLKEMRPNLTIAGFDAPTIVKRRFVEPATNRAVFAIEYLDEDRNAHCPQLVDFLKERAGSFDLVVVNDFGHGLLMPEGVAALSGAKFLCVNAQTNSMNVGFNLLTRRYPTADFICQNELEIRLDAHNKLASLDELAIRVAQAMEAKTVAITGAGRGSTLYEGGQITHVPALAREVVDTMGAGDAYLALAAPCAAAGLPAEIVGFVGGAMGALHAQVVGNRHPVDPSSLFKFLTALLK